MISFRLTPEEYDRCRELCYTQGLRSVSEMARAGINLLLQQPTRVPQETLETRVSDLEGRVRMLALEVKRLQQHPTASAAAAAGEDSKSESTN